MKQTAVEWLIEQLIPKDQHEGIMDIIEEAKEMEKQQIVDAHLNGQAEFDTQEFRKEIVNCAEQYYNETFKK